MRKLADDAEEERAKPARLSRLFVREVSLVGRPANRRRFLLWKSADKEDDMPELTDDEALAIEDALNSEAEEEAEVMERLEELAKAEKADLTDKERNAIRGALRLLSSVKDKVGPELLRKLADLAGYGYAAPEKARGKQDDQDSEEYGERPKRAAKSELPDEVRKAAVAGDYESVAQAARAHPEVTELVVTLLKSRDAEIAELRKFQAEVAAREQERQARQLVEEMNLPGMAIEDQVRLVKSLSSDQREALAAWAKALRASGVGEAEKPVGSARSGEAAGTSALDEIQQRARALVEKGGGLDEAEAMLRVMQQDPQLAARYRDELLRGGA